MSAAQLDGLFSQEANMGREDYYLFQLTSNNLSRLSELILGHLKVSDSWQTHIGGGYVRLEVISSENCSAEIIDAGGVLLRVSQNDIQQFAKRLQEMAEAESDPDYLVHMHLDNYFTVPAKGLSDIIFQRLDEYHDGT